MSFKARRSNTSKVCTSVCRGPDLRNSVSPCCAVDIDMLSLTSNTVLRLRATQTLRVGVPTASTTSSVRPFPPSNDSFSLVPLEIRRDCSPMSHFRLFKDGESTQGTTGIKFWSRRFHEPLHQFLLRLPQFSPLSPIHLSVGLIFHEKGTLLYLFEALKGSVSELQLWVSPPGCRSYPLDTCPRLFDTSKSLTVFCAYLILSDAPSIPKMDAQTLFAVPNCNCVFRPSTCSVLPASSALLFPGTLMHLDMLLTISSHTVWSIGGNFSRFWCKVPSCSPMVANLSLVKRSKIRRW